MISPVFWTKDGRWAIQFVDGFWQVYDESGDFVKEIESTEGMVRFINAESARKEMVV